jgi:hypothetical protein
MDRAIFDVAKATSAGGRAKEENQPIEETLEQRKILMRPF